MLTLTFHDQLLNCVLLYTRQMQGIVGRGKASPNSIVLSLSRQQNNIQKQFWAEWTEVSRATVMILELFFVWLFLLENTLCKLSTGLV